MAAVFGLIFCLDFIPNVGAIIATFIPLPMIFLDPNIGLTGALVCFFMLGLTQVIHEVVEPIVPGSSMRCTQSLSLTPLCSSALSGALRAWSLRCPLVIVKLVLSKSII